MPKSVIQAAARKALIAADPGYYSWPDAQQEQFRATMDKQVQNRVDAVLLKALLGIDCTPDNANAIWRDLPLSKLNLLNWAKLLTCGIGDCYLFLNEPMAKNTSLLDFTTLYDYDYNDHLFQEQANKAQLPDYQPRDYYAFRFARWARLIIDGDFHYATLYSLAGYLTDAIDDQGSDRIQSLIPHEYVDGKNHGKAEQGGFLWDIEVQANGLEAQLDELKHRWHHYQQQRWLELSQAHCQQAPVMYFQPVDHYGDPHLNIIFNNETALEKVRWRHFLADCKALQGNRAGLDELAAQELAKAEQWLQQTHQDIMANFDPKVVRLRKKRKIVMAPGALDDLLKGDEDE
ncbi:hypothetical protein QWY20_11735 [Alkalimonas sp. MEB108]|uniref:Uncharacterized protein n=1 Tax=Alkalimonas cellulosilytica TaxID=3058395 RepID=A0ABU7J6I7_9GAMM|nr:hypothetical protein [Alkalimonas sp. MEB108]MEE2002124.1 hypothetical protein [Alkalimonas sp. MEB108]